jgi:ABC-type glycerol-3-phosphate transport system permease component
MDMKRTQKKRNVIPNGANPQHFSVSQLKIYAYIVPIALVMGLPILFMFINAFKPLSEILAYPPRFYVKHPTLSNFTSLFQVSSDTEIPMSRYLFNSIIATVVTVLCNLWIALSVGYALSKKHFKLKRFMLKANTIAMSFIPVAVAIPRYFIIDFIHLSDNFLANIIPLLISPVCVFLAKQFIDQLPDALIEAAVIDGANDFQILRRVIMPLTKPTMATVAIISFQTVWNSTEASTLLLNNESLKTFAYYMTQLNSNLGNAVAGQGIAAAGTLIMFLPNLILFIFLQSGVMSTMAHSGIK